MKADGTQSRKLVSVPGPVGDVRWSPIGNILRFSVHDPMTNSSSLWQVNSDGTNFRPLIPGWNNPPAECCGKWTPDERYYVFVSTRNGMSNVWALREKQGLFRRESRKPIPLTAGPMQYSDPVVSRDGTKIFVLGSQPRQEVLRWDSKAAAFVPCFSGVSAWGLDFTKDGKWVTYVTYPEGDLWRSKADGSQRLQLTFAPMSPHLPRWAADGKLIAFSASVPGKTDRIYIVSSDGGTPRELLPGDEPQVDPNWSPDGGSLVFGGFGQGSAIYVVDLKTRDVSRVPGSQGLFSPRWSSNGRYIAAMPAGSTKMVFYDFKTRKWEDLAKVPGGWGNWSKDGSYLYFSGSSASPTIYRVRMSDRKLERVAGFE